MTRPPRSKPLLRDTEPLIRSKPRRKRNPAQPQLLFDPIPDRVEPALALLKAKPPTGNEWSWELKWDGYRLAVHIEPQGIRILTRGGHDWTHRFPAIEQAARALGPATMIIDGEAVVLDEEGRPDFGLLQQSLGASGKQGGKRASHPGHDLCARHQRSLPTGPDPNAAVQMAIGLRDSHHTVRKCRTRISRQPHTG
ncbi:hypothetical protein ACQZ64_29105, partial [Rhizobium rhizogenes]